VLKFTGGVAPDFDHAIQRVEESLDWPDAEAALNAIGPSRGGGWIAEEAVAMALFCVLRHPGDYVAAVRLGANITGDSDSVASIAGGILGARLGTAALPTDWVERLENRDQLMAVAERLARKKSELRATADQTVST
jgi:ADP-ribosylglycohydrolase